MVPAHPPTPQTAHRSAITSSIWISRPPCTVRMLAGVWRSNAESPVPTPTPAVTCPNIYIPTGGADVVCPQQCFREIPSVPRHSRRRFGSPPTTRRGEDHRPPIGPGTRWSHRGAIQDTLRGTIRTVLGARNGPTTLSHPHFALLDRNSGLAPPNQTSLPPDAHWCGTA